MEMNSNQESCMVLESFYKNSDTTHNNFVEMASLIFSIFYGIFVVNLAIVFTASHYIASVGPLDLADYYLNVLYIVSILWLISFGISVRWGCNRADAKDPIKSHHASNRWLKAVVALFGFSIIIKDALELVALSEINNPFCKHKALYILMPILHTPYIFGQVTFLFLYAKHHIQECQHLARFGIMHIMATNLSVWIATVANEANEALVFEKFDLNQPFKTVTTVLSNETGMETLEQSGELSKKSDAEMLGGLFHGNCTCITEYCRRVINADTFLYPFLIEFCLISTCLLYVSWRKVGKKAKEHIRIIRPSYKFYKAYKGPTVGALVLTATVTVILVLGAFNSTADDKAYTTEHRYLHLYEGFLVVCELLNLLACIFGFYLYKSSKKQKRKSVGMNLDVVLLFVCFIGPLLIGLFSILSFCAGSEDIKASGWWISLAYPIIDIMSTAVQITFVVYGMQHNPTNTDTFRPRDVVEDKKNRCVHQRLLHRLEECTDVLDNSLSEVETSLAANQRANYHEMAMDSNPTICDENLMHTMNTNHATRRMQNLDEPVVNRNTVVKFRLAVPGGVRIALRDVIMFLVISNASIWIFLSLDKTVFSTLSFQYYYFGHSAWMTLTAVTTPLSIFLRMHSAACFFEMWSYT